MTSVVLSPKTEHMTCLVCGEDKAFVCEQGFGSSGRYTVVTCKACNATGRITNMELFRGYELSEIEVRGLFAVARIPIMGDLIQVPNKYWQGNAVNVFYHPWWLVKTSKGLIEMGWRKRVISIDWTDTGVEKIVTEDQVTKEKHLVHAYSLIAAAKYMTVLGEAFESQIHNKAAS